MGDTRHAHRYLLLGIWVTGLVLRLIVCAQFSASPFGPLPWVDEDSYYSWARSIRDGQFLLDHPYFQDPLYPHVLAGWMLMVGDHPVSLRWVSAAIGSLLIPLTYLAGRRAVGSTAALLGAALAALYLPAIQFSVLLLKPTLVTLVVAALLWFAGRFCEHGRWRDALGIGLLCGAGCLLRGNFLLVLPVAACWMALHVWRRAAPSIQTAHATRLTQTITTLPPLACFSAGVMSCLSLSIAHNWLAARQWVLTTSQAGMVFYLGNNPEATGGFSNPSWATAVPGIEHEQFVAEARRRSGNPAMTEAESSRYWFGQARHWILQHPGRWLALCGNKLLVLIGRTEHSDNHYYEFLAERFYPWAGRWPLKWDVLLVLGAIGMTYSFCRQGVKSFALVVAAAFVASMLIFYALARYRMTLVPILLVAAGGALSGLVDDWRKRAAWQLVWRAGAIAAPLFVLSWTFQLQPGLAHQFLTTGQAYLAQGRFEDTAAYCETALFLDPTELPGYYFGHIKYHPREAGRLAPIPRPTGTSSAPADWLRWARWRKHVRFYVTADALRDMQQAAQAAASADLYYELAVLRAFHQLRSDLKPPGHLDSFDGLQLLSEPFPIAPGDRSVSSRLLTRALELDPQHPAALIAMGCMALRAGDAHRARAHWEKALPRARDRFIVLKLLEHL